MKLNLIQHRKINSVQCLMPLTSFSPMVYNAANGFSTKKNPSGAWSCGSIMKSINILTFAALSLVFGAITQKSEAAVTYFNASWSGAPNGNSATATALIGIDTSLIPNPGSYIDSVNIPAWFDSISLTVSGASSGNGSFITSDFQGVYWNTQGGTLDFFSELVGQATSALTWGSTPGVRGASGDFNIFRASGSPTAPSGTLFFQLTPAGSSNVMNLVSLAPVPESSSSLLSACGMAFFLLRRKKS